MKKFTANHVICAEASTAEYCCIANYSVYPFDVFVLSGNRAALNARVFWFTENGKLIDLDTADIEDVRAARNNPDCIVLGFDVYEHSAYAYNLNMHKKGDKPNGYLIISREDWECYLRVDEAAKGKRRKWTERLFTADNVTEAARTTLHAMTLYANGWLYEGTAYNSDDDECIGTGCYFEDEADALNAACDLAEEEYGQMPVYDEDDFEVEVTYTFKPKAA